MKNINAERSFHTLQETLWSAPRIASHLMARTKQRWAFFLNQTSVRLYIPWKTGSR